MSLAKELLDKMKNLDEGKHYNTKVRAVEAKNGSRKIRLGVKESKRMVNEMLKPGNNAPNPRDKESKKNLEECVALLSQTEKRLKEVKDSKRPMKESVNESSMSDVKFPVRFVYHPPKGRKFEMGSAKNENEVMKLWDDLGEKISDGDLVDEGDAVIIDSKNKSYKIVDAFDGDIEIERF